MKRSLLFLATLFCFTLSLKAQVMPTIIADGFTSNLIGIDLDSVGNVWLTESGTGNDDGKITILAPDGSKTLFMTGLPSAINPATGEIAGPTRTYHQPGNTLLIIMGEGTDPLAEAILWVDKDDFTLGTPLTTANVMQVIKIGDFVHDQGFMQSNPYNIAWDAQGNMYVADAGGNSIVKRDLLTGNLSLVTTLPPVPNPLPFGPPVMDPVPTDILAKPDGTGFYVSQLTGFPFADNAATIYKLDNAGNLTPWQTDFTLLTDLGYDPNDGNLVALQFSQFGMVDSTLNFIPGMGRLLKVFPNGDREVIAQNFIGLAPSFDFDAAGNLYVTDLFGFVYKYDLASGTDEQTVFATQATAFPNPFAGQTNIGFELKKAATVELNIYHVNGRLVKTFAPQEMQPGIQRLTWDAAGAEPGMYIYHILVDGHLASGIVNLVK